MAILTIRVYGKVDLVTITFLPIDLYIHICIVCFDEYLLSSIQFTIFTQTITHLVFQFLLGITIVPRQIEDNGYAKFWVENKVLYGPCENSEFGKLCLKTH